MSDAVYIEMPQKPKKSRLRRFFGFLFILLVLAGVGAAAFFSWWLSEGKIASSFARVDAMIYTVDANFPTVVESLLVKQGETVTAGQPLAHVDTTDLAQRLAGTFPPQQQQHDIPPMDEIAGRINASEAAEKRMASRLAQAKAEEDRYQQMHHERVTDHVRALLALRAINPANIVAHEEARRNEAIAKSRMDQSRDEFEKVSKMRAGVETELVRIRSEIFRNKQRSSRMAPKPAAPPPPQVPAAAKTLYAVANGQIMAINAVPGQQIPAGTPVFYILPADQSSERWIEAWFPANAKNLLKLGQRGQIRIGDIHLDGIVSAIADHTQTYAQGASSGYAQYLPVRIQIQDQEELAKIKPGTPAECQIQTRYLLGEKFF